MHIPKCGCSTLTHWFAGIQHVNLYERRNLVRLYGLGLVDSPDEILQKYFTFVFVRDPWSRVVSAFLDLKIRHPLQNKEKPRDLTFRNFAMNLVVDRNPHWKPLRAYLPEDVVWDKVWRTHEMSERLMELSQRFSLSWEPHIYNGLEYSKEEFPCVADWGARKIAELPAFPSYRCFYDKELKEQIGRLYTDDIQRFGFVFGEQP